MDWFTTATGGEEWDFSKPVRATMTLYGRWVAAKFSVTFDGQGGSTPPTQQVGANDVAADPGTPIRTGYSFRGWLPQGGDGNMVWDFRNPVTTDITLVARWVHDQYSVVFDSQGGSAVPPQVVNSGDRAAEPASPVRAGYKFNGWWTTSDNSGLQLNWTTSITNPLDLFAHWTLIKPVIVKFAGEGGSSPGPITVDAGAVVADPGAAHRAGYSFAGWWTTATGGVRWDFSTPVTSNTTLYAQWIALTDVVSFNSNGGTHIDPQTIQNGTVAVPPPVPTRAGYSFAGWWTTATGGVHWDFSTPVTSNTTLYAQWVALTDVVSFNSNGGTHIDPQTMQNGTVAVPPAVPTRAGYSFAGWWTTATGGVRWDFSTPVTSNTTLYAQWIASTDVVSFNSNGGTHIDPQTMQNGTVAVPPAVPTRAGYSFAGWWTTATGGVRWDFSTPVTSNTTLYAQWIASTDVVSFDSNGGTQVDPQTIQNGKLAVAPAVPTRAGYSFAGWWTTATGGVRWNFSTPVTSNTTLYAQWIASTDVVSFDSNGGTQVDPQTIQNGKLAVAPAVPTRAGYSFAGWWTTATGGVRWDFSTPVTSNTTLYAQWVALTDVVSFNSNGGTHIDPQTMQNGTVAVPPAVPTRAGYSFAGWWTTATGGVRWNFSTPVTSNTTLYAQWTTESTPSPSPGGTASGDQPDTGGPSVTSSSPDSSPGVPESSTSTPPHNDLAYTGVASRDVVSDVVAVERGVGV